jgi:integrase
MSHSALSLVDVTTLKPEHIARPSPGNPIVAVTKQRIKTNRMAHTSIPVRVLQMLQSFQPESPDYFFWSGQGDYLSRTNKWWKRMKKIFKAAGIPGAHPHMFRHTVVRDLYLRRQTERYIADVLGDTPATVTKHYSSFDQSRHEAVQDMMRQIEMEDPAYLQLLKSSAPSSPVN